MGIPIPGPSDLVRLAGRGYQALESAIALVPRLIVLVGEVEQLLGRVSSVMSGVEELQGRASSLVERTGTVIDEAGGLTSRVSGLLKTFEPTLDRLEAIATRLAETTSPSEVDAVVTVVNMLPEVVDKLRADILPILDTLDTVAPDLRDLLEVSRELNEILGAVPGLGRIKRRIEAAERQEDRREEEPAGQPSEE